MRALLVMLLTFVTTMAVLTTAEKLFAPNLKNDMSTQQPNQKERKMNAQQTKSKTEATGTGHPARGENMKNGQDYTVTFLVDNTPKEVFDAINNVRGWWSGKIEGNTDKLGAAFIYRYEDVHYSKQEITELIPGKKVFWHVADARLGFVKDKSEWKGTDIVFEISKKGSQTEVRFTHMGLEPAFECYGECSNAWGMLINGNLRNLITTGKVQPNVFAR